MLLLAFLDWFAIYNKYERINYLTKPATFLALMAWFYTVGGLQGGQMWFGLGLLFSLIGDVMLMLPERFAFWGLLAFFFAQLTYIFGFNETLPPIGVPFYVLLLTVGGLGAAMYGVIHIGIMQQAEHRKKLIAVMAYGAAASMMLFSAVMTLFRAEWGACASGLAAAGGALFFGSDFFLFFNRFVQPLANARLWVRISYHLGQLSLAAGVLMHFAIQ